MGTIANLAIKITGDIGGLKSALGEAKGALSDVAGNINQIGSQIRGVGEGMTAAVTLPILGVATAAVKMASDLNESSNKIDVIFGKSAGAVKAWAESSATALGVSKQEAYEALGAFGNLFKSVGINQDVTTKMSENLVQLASDLASFNNLDPTEVLEKLRSGMVGQTEPLRSLGINLSEAAVKQQALAMGLASTEKALTPAMLMQARYVLIMKATKDAQGDFARTSDGLANSQRIIAASIKDAGAALGTVLLPYVAIGAAKLKDLVAAFNGLSDGTKRWIVFGALALAAIGPLLIGLGTLVSGISLLLGPLGLLVAAVGLLAVAWTNDWGGIQEKTQAVIAFLRPGFEQLLSWIDAASQGNFGPLKEGLQGALQSINATIQAFKWSDFIATLADWGAYIAPIAWDAFIAALEWGAYIGKLAWAAILPVLASWGEYITSLDWKQIITTAIDWGTWILALDWAAFIKAIEWGTYIAGFVWSEWISKIDWSGYVSSFSWSDFIEDLTWVAKLPALAWSDFIEHLEWLGVIDKVSWDSFVSQLTWSSFVIQISDWGAYIKSLDWNAIITTALDWAQFVGKIEWSGFVTVLSWGSYISSLAWAAILPVLASWGEYITSLDWTKIIITTIDWATWIPALAWNTVIAAIDWATYLSTLDWSSHVPNLTWSSFITGLSDWSSYIVSLDWSGYITRLADWSGYIGEFAWSSFVSKLNWPSDATAFTWSTWISKFTWPSITWSGWSAFVEKFTWPSITWDGWKAFISTLTWPSITWDGWRAFIPTFTWPSIPAFPGWSSLMSAVGLGSNASGTNSWRGGPTWVGEKGTEAIQLPTGKWLMAGTSGPQLMDLPAGTKIYNHDATVRMTKGGVMAIGQNAAGTTPLPTAGSYQPLFEKAINSNTALGENTRALKESSKAHKEAIGDLKSALSSTPGLMHTSEVTQKQLDMAKLGIPQNFADDWIRHLTDNVINGAHWKDADIKDAALRAGIDPTLPAKAILELVKDKWNDQSLFADKKNLDLINMDAVKATMEQQAKSKLGQQNLYALFGIQPDQVQGQAAALGGQLRTGIDQGLAGAGGAGLGAGLVNNMANGITPKNLQPVATKILGGISTSMATAQGDDKQQVVDFGGALLDMINAQLDKKGLFDKTGQLILTKIAGSWGDGTPVDVISKIAGTVEGQMQNQNVIDALKRVGAHMVKIVFQGFDEEAAGQNWTGAVKVAKTGGGSNTTTTTQGHALGTAYSSGGWRWVGETGRELMYVPRGAGIMSNPEAEKTAALGVGVTVNMAGAVIRDERDVHMLAYQVEDIIERRKRRG